MKERKNTSEALTGIAGLICNALLAAGKIVAGALTGLVSVIADGINNLSDCGASIVALVSFRVSKKPADREHPYGHRRMEYVASICIAFLVLILSFELGKESLGKAIAGTREAFVWWIYLILAISFAVKAGMFLLYRYVAAKTGSYLLRAAATDSACDCIATFSVLVGALISQFAGVAVDGWVGLLVAIFIAWQGISLLKDAGSELLGQAPDAQLVTRVKQLLMTGEGVVGVHDVRLFCYGKDVVYATAHVEMDAEVPSLRAHTVLDGLEREAAKEGIQLTLHLDPLVLDDEEATLLEERVRAAVEGIADGMDIHDFRLVHGACTKVLFEVAVPFDCPLSDAQLCDDIRRAVRVLGDYDPSVTVKRE